MLLAIFEGGGREYSVLFNLCIIFFQAQLYSKVFQAVRALSAPFPIHIRTSSLLCTPSLFEDLGWKRGASEVAAAFLHAGSEAKGQEGNPRPSEAIIKPH